LTQFLIRDDDNKPVECQFPWPGKAKTKENREAKTAREKEKRKKEFESAAGGSWKTP